MKEKKWAVGVDLGGTKIEVAQVYEDGRLHRRSRLATDIDDGPSAVENQIATAVRELQEHTGSTPVAIGVGVAGQIEPTDGFVRFAPNLKWHDVPLQADLSNILERPVVVTNDVRAITWGEWLHGAGQGYDDMICLFVGTGIGGGIVSGGRMLAGCSNTAGELGHITIDLRGPACHCGNQGCLEALAGGWAIARRAQEIIRNDPGGGRALLDFADGNTEAVTAKTVARAAHAGDPLARGLVNEVGRALTGGIVSLVNAFNPCCLILGGGVIKGLPELVERVDTGVRERALAAATASLQIVRAQLNGDAGVVGAAALAMRSFGDNGG
jgi:glucokinase